MARPEGTLKSSRRAQSLPGGGKYTQSPDDEGTKANGCFYAAKMSFISLKYTEYTSVRHQTFVFVHL